MKPYVHSQLNAKKYGGKPEDYLPINQKMDSSKQAHPSNLHRIIFHTDFGIFIIEDIFGVNITNSDGKLVSVRDIAEDHVLQDFGGKFIPSLGDFLQEVSYQEWMNNGSGEPPPSAKKVLNRPRKRRVIEVDVNNKDSYSIYKKEVDRD